MQTQHRPQTRAPHGNPEFTETLAFKATKDHRRLFQRKGGSAWLRSLIDRQRQHEEVIRRAEMLLAAIEAGKFERAAAINLKTAIRKVQA
jgi:hypothetical protein